MTTHTRDRDVKIAQLKGWKRLNELEDYPDYSDWCLAGPLLEELSALPDIWYIDVSPPENGIHTVRLYFGAPFSIQERSDFTGEGSSLSDAICEVYIKVREAAMSTEVGG